MDLERADAWGFHADSRDLDGDQDQTTTEAGFLMSLLCMTMWCKELLLTYIKVPMLTYINYYSPTSRYP